MKLNRVIFASFPRSGRHLTMDVLTPYFGDDLKVCDWLKDFRKRPEINPETNFTKIHDQYLTHPIDPQYKYLVVVRHPIYSINSWRLHHRDEHGEILENQETSRWKLEFWAKWFNKWALSDIPNRLIVQYESMISNPMSTFESMIRFVGDKEPELDRLMDIVERANIGPKPNSTAQWIGWI